MISVAGRTSSGKSWKYILLTAWARPFGIVQHDHAAAQGGPAEHDARHLGPAAAADVLGRVVAEHQHVQVVDRDPLRTGPRAAELVQVVGQNTCISPCGAERARART